MGASRALPALLRGEVDPNGASRQRPLPSASSGVAVGGGVKDLKVERAGEIWKWLPVVVPRCSCSSLAVRISEEGSSVEPSSKRPRKD